MKVTRRMTQSPEARAAILAQAQAMGISVEDFDTIERGERTMTHTPGPYHISHDEGGGTTIRDDDDLIIAGVYGFAAPDREGQEEANGTLLAAAPELLAALRELRAAFAHVATSTASLALLDRTSAAISKAE